MPTTQRTHGDRLRRHLFKKLSVTVKSLRFSSLLGRIQNPPILLNSIPKSGTHLLEAYLESFRGIHNAGWKTIIEDPKLGLDVAVGRISRIPSGGFANAHIRYDASIEKITQVSGLRIVFLVRDPRDIAVSRLRYILDLDHLHPGHAPLRKLRNDSERLTACIVGIDGAIPSLQSTLERFSGWLDADEALTVRFEDLVGPKGGGTDVRRRTSLISLAAHLRCDLSEADLDRAIAKVSDQSTSTLRKGVVGSWVSEFSESHFQIFQDGPLAMWLEKYGYH